MSSRQPQFCQGKRGNFAKSKVGNELFQGEHARLGGLEWLLQLFLLLRGSLHPILTFGFVFFLGVL